MALPQRSPPRSPRPPPSLPWSARSPRSAPPQATWRRSPQLRSPQLNYPLRSSAMSSPVGDVIYTSPTEASAAAFLLKMQEAQTLRAGYEELQTENALLQRHQQVLVERVERLRQARGSEHDPSHKAKEYLALQAKVAAMEATLRDEQANSRSLQADNLELQAANRKLAGRLQASSMRTALGAQLSARRGEENARLRDENRKLNFRVMRSTRDISRLAVGQKKLETDNALLQFATTLVQKFTRRRLQNAEHKAINLKWDQQRALTQVLTIKQQIHERQFEVDRKPDHMQRLSNRWSSLTLNSPRALPRQPYAHAQTESAAH